MTVQSRNFMFRTSGIAVAAFVVASMSVHDHRAVANAQTSAVSNATFTSVNNGKSLHVTKIDSDGMTPTIAHHYY